MEIWFKKYLILNGISPEYPMEIIMDVHSHCNPSVLWMNQSVQIVAMDVTYKQVSAIRKEQGRDSSCSTTSEKQNKTS